MQTPGGEKICEHVLGSQLLLYDSKSPQVSYSTLSDHYTSFMLEKIQFQDYVYLHDPNHKRKMSYKEELLQKNLRDSSLSNISKNDNKAFCVIGRPIYESGDAGQNIKKIIKSVK